MTEHSSFRTLVLVRHGAYDTPDRHSLAPEAALNHLGVRQSELLATRLGKMALPFSTVISSSMMRSIQTAGIVGQRLNLPIQRDSMIDESVPKGIDPAALDLKPIPGAEAQFDRAWAKYRITEFGPVTLLVCHGDLIRWFVCRTLGVNPEHWTQMGIANCSVTAIQLAERDRCRLLLYNDIGHLPAGEQTWDTYSKGGLIVATNEPSRP